MAAVVDAPHEANCGDPQSRQTAARPMSRQARPGCRSASCSAVSTRPKLQACLHRPHWSALNANDVAVGHAIVSQLGHQALHHVVQAGAQAAARHDCVAGGRVERKGTLGKGTSRSSSPPGKAHQEAARQRAAVWKGGKPCRSGPIAPPRLPAAGREQARLHRRPAHTPTPAAAPPPSLATLTSAGLNQMVSRAPARRLQGGSGTHSCSMLASSHELWPSAAEMHLAPADSADANLMAESATRSSSLTKPPPKLLCTWGSEQGGKGGRMGSARVAAAVRKAAHRPCRVQAPPGRCHAHPASPSPASFQQLQRTTKGLGRGRSRWRSEGHSSTSSTKSGVSTCTWQAVAIVG